VVSEIRHGRPDENDRFRVPEVAAKIKCLAQKKSHYQEERIREIGFFLFRRATETNQRKQEEQKRKVKYFID